ncbi:transposase, partial [Escherichia coli]|uniref:transposase n=1 Tax=Escherichia coli TaxID=562 RepID=UPI003D9B3E95
MELKGVGPTTACALVAVSVMHMILKWTSTAAWLGLTPSQYSSGGKSKLGRI